MIKALLTDIEGTTSSIHFVKNVLFPYAAKHLADFVREHLKDPQVSSLLKDLWAEYPELDQNPEASISRLLEWIEEDRKHTVLKSLQGMIWRFGYEAQDYTAHVYPDAHQNLLSWNEQGLPIYIFSSGSIGAQKLFFKHCDFGDLSGLFRGHFDTTSGAKTDPAAYCKIQSEIGIPAQDILFLSDVPAELDAAIEAGMRTTLLIRPEDSTISTSDRPQHPSVQSFDDIDLHAFN